MRKILTVSLATMLSFGTVQAQEILLEGNLDCATWASSREAKASVALEHYLLGFINGLALGNRKDFWEYPSRIKREQVHYWMDKYCAENPLQYVVYGALALFEERFGKGWDLQ